MGHRNRFLDGWRGSLDVDVQNLSRSLRVVVRQEVGVKAERQWHRLDLQASHLL